MEQNMKQHYNLAKSHMDNYMSHGNAPPNLFLQGPKYLQSVRSKVAKQLEVRPEEVEHFYIEQSYQNIARNFRHQKKILMQHSDRGDIPVVRQEDIEYIINASINEATKHESATFPDNVILDGDQSINNTYTSLDEYIM